MNQIDEFFDGLPSQDKKETDVFTGETPATAEQAENKVVESVPVEGDELRKNRWHRRFEKQLADEREARIRAEARAEAASEVSKFTSDMQTGNVDERWLRIYGDTPETREAWRLQQDILNDYKVQAKEEAIEETRRERTEMARQEREYETFIDSQLEAIEDEFNVDITSNTPAAHKARNELLEIVAKTSPKNAEGEITDYADFGAAWEFYQLKQTKDKGSTDRQREISSRSMARSNGSTTTESKITPGFDGWRKDYGMN